MGNGDGQSNGNGDGKSNSKGDGKSNSNGDGKSNGNGDGILKSMHSAYMFKKNVYMYKYCMQICATACKNQHDGSMHVFGSTCTFNSMHMCGCNNRV